MLIVADAKGVTDGVMHQVCEKINSPIPIVLVAWSHRFRLNKELLSLKDFLLVDVCEYGYDHVMTDSHIFGGNSEKFSRYYSKDWIDFDNWVKENPPKLLLKRELMKKDVSDTVKPIDYPCFFASKEIQSKEAFDGRPVSSFFYWGRSHEARLRLHSNIWKAASEKGFSVCDNINYFDKFIMEEDGRKWVTLWIPHYGRMDMKEILGRQNFSKTSIALPGAGVKTFRHCESSVNSVMVKWKDELAWSYDWNEANCILTEEGKEIEDIEAALQNPNLYEIYLKGIENCQKYSLPNYIKHIESIIKQTL
jgi:hypothetical protein